MLSEDAKYIYVKDDMGELIGTVIPPFECDCVFLKVISMKKLHDTEWEDSARGVDMAMRLKSNKKHLWKLYDDYQEFCEEFFDAIL